MKKWVLLTLALILAFSLAACSSKDKQSATGTDSVETQEIVFQSWITPNLTAEYYDGVIKAFEAENPGIKVKRIQPPANEGSPDNYLKMLLTSGDFPDVIHNASIQLFVDADALMEIPIDDDIKKINNYEKDFINGKLYNIDSNRQPQTLIFYNKKMFADAGITATPTTWAELEDASAKLKAKGHTPLLTSGDWASGYVFAALTSPTLFLNNKAWYKDRYDGKVKFTDKDWLEAANFFNGLVNKGYFNKGALSIDYAAVEQEFLKGNGAMLPMGSWFSVSEAIATKDFEVGVFPAPTKDGTVNILGNENGAGFAVSKKSKHADAAIKFAKYMILNPDSYKNYLKADALFSNLKQPVDWEMTPLQKEIADMIRTKPPMGAFFNNKVGSVPVSGIADQYSKVAQNILLGGADVTKEMKSLDDYWDKNSK